MAIKLHGVGGEKLLATEKDAKTQDFIMIAGEYSWLGFLIWATHYRPGAHRSAPRFLVRGLNKGAAVRKTENWDREEGYLGRVLEISRQSTANNCQLNGVFSGVLCANACE